MLRSLLVATSIRTAKMLVRDYAQAWLVGRDVRPSTAAMDHSYVHSYILPTFGDSPIGKIRAGGVSAWKMALLGDKSPATVGKAITLFKSMMQRAVIDGLLPTNPIAAVKLPRIEREEMRFLTPEELARPADAIDPRYRALVFVGGYGGLRIGELAGLLVADLDMLRGVVKVQRQVVEVGGKLTVSPLKTRAAQRQVRLPHVAVDELGRHLAQVVSFKLSFMLKLRCSLRPRVACSVVQPSGPVCGYPQRRLLALTEFECMTFGTRPSVCGLLPGQPQGGRSTGRAYIGSHSV